MTTDEKRQQKADLLLTYQEAKEEYAHLQEKLSRRIQYLADVEKWLKDSVSYCKNNLEPEFARFAATSHLRGLPTEDALEEDVKTMFEARRKLVSLEDRLRALGLHP